MLWATKPVVQTRGASTLRRPHTAARSSLRLVQLEKACMQQKTQHSPKLNAINGSQGAESLRITGLTHIQCCREGKHPSEGTGNLSGDQPSQFTPDWRSCLGCRTCFAKCGWNQAHLDRESPASPPTHHLPLFRAEGAEKAGMQPNELGSEWELRCTPRGWLWL